MNISSTQSPSETQQSSQTIEKNNVSETEKASANVKQEEKKEVKDSNEKSDFQKFLEEPQSTDKISVEQQIPVNQNQNLQINENYANKFGFDVVSGFKNLKAAYNYDSMSISKEDAKFFVDMVENKQFAIQQDGDKTNLIKFADEVGPTYKAQQTSQVLTDLINKAYNDQKPVRIDFDNNVSVILKIDTKGKISAEFIPGDKAVEAYLKNNIGFLKQRFDDQNLAYNDIMYRQSNHNQQHRERQQQRQNKGE